MSRSQQSELGQGRVARRCSEMRNRRKRKRKRKALI